MSDIEKKMNNLPKLIYEKSDGHVFVIGFQSQPQNENIRTMQRAILYFDEMNELYKGEKDDDDYNKRLVYLYRRIRNLVEESPISVADSRKILEQLNEEDILRVSKQADMYLYVRSIYSKYK